MKTRGLRHVRQESQKNVPIVFVFYCKNVLEKVEVGLRSPKTRPLKPHLSSGNAENELPEPRIEDNVSGQISKKTCENVWVFVTFRRKRKKRAKACMKNTRTTARSQKRNKTHGFGQMFEERASKTMKKEAWNRGPKARKTRENACVLQHF